MKEFIIYAAEVSLCISLFLLVYKTFLRQATFFKFNRFYLIFGLIISFIIPTIQFTYDVVIQATSMNIAGQEENMSILDKSLITSDIWFILLTIYIAGIIILSGRNIVSYKKLYKLIRNGKSIKESQYTVVEHKGIDSPFSFFKYVLFNREKLSDIEKELILQHEITHIKQKHWLDLFCCECALILQWFNPFMWLYIFHIKENHEFLADNAVIRSGRYSPALYQAVLVNQRFQGPVFSFTNSFNYSNHLNRLTMIKKVKTSPWKRLTILTLLPAWGLFFWVSAKPNYVIQNAVENSPITILDETQQINPNPTGKSVNDSVVVVGYGSIPKTKDRPINDSVVVIGYGSMPKNTTDIEIQFRPNNDELDTNNALYIIDGKESSYKIMNSLNPKNIKAISVLKNPAETKKYGEKGKHGVVMVSLKENGASEKITINSRAIINTDGISASPLIILDGKKYTGSINEIPPTDIESINVLKDNSAVELYGDEAKEGVVIIKKKNQ